MVVGVAVGFIALAGAAAETGVVVLNYLEQAMAELKASASWRVGSSAVPTCSGRRSEEHTSELQSLMRISYAVFCLKKKNKEYKIQILDKIKKPQIRTQQTLTNNTTAKTITYSTILI